MIENIVLPSLGEGVLEGTVINVFVQQGDLVEEQQGIIEVETDKVALEVPAEIAGVIDELLVEVGTVIKVGDAIAKITTTTKNEKAATIKPTNEPKKEKSTGETNIEEITYKKEVSNTKVEVANNSLDAVQPSNKKFRASPLARKFARELGVDINTIELNGNRVTVQVVKDFVKSQNLHNTKNPNYSIRQNPLPNFSKWGTTTNKALTSIEKATLRNMEYSWATIPHAWISEKVDLTNLEATRQKHKNAVKQAGGSLTITSLLVKACTIALQKHPIFNSSLDVFKQEIIYKNFYNIGVAVDTERGLMVPVIKNTDAKSLTEISKDLTLLSQNATSKKTTMNDLEGATFSISNLGGIGSTGIMPIINSPEVGILGVGASEIRPKWMDNEFKPRLIAPITISFDHRVINGADALRFLITIKQTLEDSFLMLL